MKNILVEDKFGHGGVRTIGSKIRTKIRRMTRSKLGMASIPFDWVTGFHIKNKIGNIPIKNQGQSSSCGGQAKSYFVGVVNAIFSNQPYVEQSAKSIYSQVFFIGGGTTVPALERDLGTLDEAILPSYQNGQAPTESFMVDRSWMTSDKLKQIMAQAGWTAISVNIDMESIAEAIRDYGAIIWEITGQNNGTWLSGNPIPPSNKNPGEKWNHFMCSAGAGMLNGKQTIDMFQSWGIDVGDAGIQHFTSDYINSGYIIDCFTFVKKKPNYKFTVDMQYGDKSNDVLQLQKRLNVWNSGYFGILTWTAVVLYQKIHGLPETGYCGPLTRALLNNS